MGIYVYKVTPEIKSFDGVLVNVMKYAYKPYSFNDQFNNQMRFGAQVWRADKLVQSDEFTGKVTFEGDGPFSKDWVEYPKELIERGDGCLDDYEFETLLQEKRSKKQTEESVIEVEIYRCDMSNIEGQKKLLLDSDNYIDLDQEHVATIKLTGFDGEPLEKVLDSAWKSSENFNFEDEFENGWIGGPHIKWAKSSKGVRSNVVGDHFKINGVTFRVEHFGFKQLHQEAMSLRWEDPQQQVPSPIK